MNDKMDLGLRLKVIVDMLDKLAQEAGCNISVLSHKNEDFTASVHLHYGDYINGTDAMVSINDDDDIRDAFLIDRDDTVREEAANEAL